VEHEWVRELADQVRTEIDKLAMDFTICASDHQNWGYSATVAKLRKWLLTQALRQTNQNYTEAAKMLGVKRTTLYQWQTQGEDTKSRARTVRG
jgi:transcriptional regulator with PAS, ATPase and Fis domain